MRTILQFLINIITNVVIKYYNTWHVDLVNTLKHVHSASLQVSPAETTVPFRLWVIIYFVDNVFSIAF